MHKERNGLKKKIKGMTKAAIVLLLSLIIPLTSIPVSAAQNEKLDPERKGSLSITFTLNGEPISDGNKVGIYKVADVVEDEGYKFVLKEEFASVGELPENLDAENEALSLKLDKIARDNGLTLYKGSQALDADGNATFSDLEVGLYLIVHTVKTEITLSDKSKVIYTINPFLISIPQNNDGKLTYDVSTKPKVSPEKAVQPPPPPDVPQTGQLWWPVMALGAVGALFLAIGMVRKMKSK